MPGDYPACRLTTGLTRRQALRVGAVALAPTAVDLAPGSQVVWAAAVQREVAPGLVIRPRQAWVGGQAPRRTLQVEARGDVRFLLVHHTANTNSYGVDDVADQLRGFVGYHTSVDKGWPDIAYNVLVDRYGGVWKGRHGSLSAPVMPDATGGSQGFAQLACFIGDLGVEPPTPEARTSMLRVPPPTSEPVAPASPRKSLSPSQAPSRSPSSTAASPARLSTPTPTGVPASDAGATSPPYGSDAGMLAAGVAAGAALAAGVAGVVGRHRKIRSRSARHPTRAGSTRYVGSPEDGTTEVGTTRAGATGVGSPEVGFAEVATHSVAPLNEEGKR